MNKKRYTAPRTERLKVETRGILAMSGSSLNRGEYNEGEDYGPDMPDVDYNGDIFGD